MVEIEQYLADLRERVNAALSECIPAKQNDPLRLVEASRQALLGGGKRLRPCLTLAASSAVGGTFSAAMPSACAIEMIHAYSLVHDDLPAMDNAETRRGQPTSHKRFGEAAAILVGDALLTMAFEVLGRPRGDGQSSQEDKSHTAHFANAAVELAVAAGIDGMVGGQAHDIALLERAPTFNELEDCHRRKTAALFRAAAVLGALAAGAKQQTVEQMRRYGECFGLAFQHADDLLDEDFPQYRDRSLGRCRELTQEAQAIADSLGPDAEPLVALADLVRRRAEAAMGPSDSGAPS